MVADITPRKLAEEALSSVSRRLIEAQETERARIARDLHDDIGQGLALLTVTLDQIKHLTSDSTGEVRRCMDQLQRQISEITASVQALSHDLHPFKLQLLGVVAAMKSFCTELSELHRVEIDFTDQGIPRTMSPKISLCLFRVLQEACTTPCDTAVYATSRYSVRGHRIAVHLTVRDNGNRVRPRDGGTRARAWSDQHEGASEAGWRRALDPVRTEARDHDRGLGAAH